jgi:hypothetical protein
MEFKKLCRRAYGIQKKNPFMALCEPDVAMERCGSKSELIENI